MVVVLVVFDTGCFFCLCALRCFVAVAAAAGVVVVA